ncbi:PHO2 Acid phosphatase [Candida maltosa Xu316]|uniref:Acid phosphatase, putative n=1 Tax=Candida maltosa (strain Xu316) TaxID=1245528 RepID=M3JTQ3_CANMX|nr:Acid phosphatase,  putative [Candida maltosa Xu316]
MYLMTAILLLLASALAKNILLTNDDGWASTEIRATYYKLKDAGHNVFLVAPVSQRSGYAGKFDLPSSPTLQTNGEFSHPKAAAPSWGHEVDDDHIWYFNGTPASCTAVGLDYIIPTFGDNVKVDLVVSAVNQGNNAGPAAYTGSGTIAGAYIAVYRGYGAVAFSGANSNNSFFKDSLDLNDDKNPSTLYATKVVQLVNQLFKSQGDNPRVLGLGVGLNVNFPPAGYDDEKCLDPSWVFTRMTGEGAYAIGVSFNNDTKSFRSVPKSSEAVRTCSNGDCALPCENHIVSNGLCQSSISAFSVDYSANTSLTSQVKDLLKPLFKT